jgi:ATP-dependent DNA helicase RecG
MNLQELKRLVAKGESDRLEFKRTTGQRTDAAKTVCAMLNGLGGFVNFGVGDNGELVGQEIGQRTVEEVTNELARIEPPAFPEVEIVTFETGRSFIVLRVPGSGGLYNFDGRYYLRVRPTTRPMPRHEYERRLVERLHGTRRWENEPVSESVTIADLDADEIPLTLENAISGAAGFAAAHFVHVLRIDETASGFSVTGFEAFPLFGEGVEGIINPVFTPEGMVPLFHGSFLIRASHRIVPTC